MPRNNKPPILLIGLVILAAIAFFVFGGLGSNNDRQNIPVSGDEEAFDNLGRVYAARSVDQAGCPLVSESRFDSLEPVYVGLRESVIPAGTTAFARLYYEGDPIEDTQLVRTEQDLDGACIWFAFEPGRNGFEEGTYRAQILVNGTPVDDVQFTVSQNGSSGFISRSDGIELGRVFTSTRVSNQGCPADSVRQFYSDESVYVSAEESFVPAGTEMFARLRFEGRPIEDTEVIRADRDTQSCIWFMFEPGRSGFEAGDYEVELFANGDVVESVNFEVE